MKLIVGLGNLGEKYENTRHNVGFVVLDALALKVSSGLWVKDIKNETLYTKNHSLILIKPLTFMNDSGTAVSKIANYYKIKPTDIYVVHDDLDIKLGEYKIQKGVGPKVHGGVASIEEKLGTKDFWRVRIGVDNRDPKKRVSGEVYVLQNFTKEESELLELTKSKIINELQKNLDLN